MTFAEILKRLMEERNITVAELARFTDIPDSTIRMILKRNSQSASIDVALKIANFFDVSPYFLNGTPDPEVPTKSVTLSRVPIYGTIPAGAPALATEYITGYEYIDVEDPENHFFLQIKGDSMTGLRITDGDLVLIKKQDSAEDGQIVAVLVNGEDATLKTYKATDNGIWLIPANPAYTPVFVTQDQIEKDPGYLRILGVLKKLVVNF